MSDEEVVKTKPVEVDLNDLSLADEEISVDADADAFAGPPPPDDGDHLVKLSLGKRKVTMGKAKTGDNFFMVDINAKVVAGPFENRILFDNASTMVMQNSGTCRIAGVLKALGEQVPSRTTKKDIARSLVDKLAGEPQSTVTSQWTAFCQSCKDDFEQSHGKRGKKNGIMLRGQRNFPSNGSDHGHKHQVECVQCGSLLSARAEIVAYKSAGA